MASVGHGMASNGCELPVIPMIKRIWAINVEYAAPMIPYLGMK